MYCKKWIGGGPTLMTLLASSGGRAVCRDGISARFTNTPSVFIKMISSLQRETTKESKRQGSNGRKQLLRLKHKIESY